jgi:ectoine hydroxylase-related dioxygenase (phytanoyl-CoA dioxygenase family)
MHPFEDSTPLLGDHARLRERAANDGFLFFEDILPADLVDPVRSCARRHFERNGWIVPAAGNPPHMDAVQGAALEGRGWDDPRWLDFQYVFSADDDFQRLAGDGKIAEILEVLIGEPVWSAAVNFCWLKLPGSPEHTTLPHQDRYYLPDCPRMWTVWVPLVDTSFEVGPLGCIPGSHALGMWNHVDALTAIEVPKGTTWASSEVKVGDIVLFDSLTVHCAWSNVSRSRARVSADIRYEPQSVGDASLLRPPEPRVLFRDGRGLVARSLGSKTDP